MPLLETTWLLLVLAALPTAVTWRAVHSRQHCAFRWLDLGAVFMWIAFLYSFVPIMGILLAARGVGNVTDARFHGAAAEPTTVLAAGWCYAACMTGFGGAYLFGRRYSISRQATQLPMAWKAFRSVLIVGISIKVANVILRTSVGADTGGDYLSSYLTLRESPLLLQQGASLLGAMDMSATILLVVSTLAYRPGLTLLVAGLLLTQVQIAVVTGGSRMAATLGVFALVAAHITYGRRISRATLSAIAVMGIALFLLVGVVRSGSATIDIHELWYGLQNNEFSSVFLNSTDLSARQADDPFPMAPESMYLVDVLRMVPQQVTGAIKADPAVTYVSTYYPEYWMNGGGLAFGVVAESIVGYGAVEAFLRGVVIGIGAALVSNACLWGTVTAMRMFVHIWFVIMCFQSLRYTSLAPATLFVIQAFPLLIGVRVLDGLVPNVVTRAKREGAQLSQ